MCLAFLFPATVLTFSLFRKFYRKENSAIWFVQRKRILIYRTSSRTTGTTESVAQPVKRTRDRWIPVALLVVAVIVITVVVLLLLHGGGDNGKERCYSVHFSIFFHILKNNSPERF